MLISLLEFVSLFKRLITTQIIQITPFSSFSFPVIAVMFTFSFNTAFAAGDAATSAEAVKLAEAKAYAETLVSANYDNAYKAVVKKALSYEPTSTTKKAIWDGIDAKAAVQNFINEKYLAAAKEFDQDWATLGTKELAGAIFTDDTYVLSEKDSNGAVKVVSEQLEGIMFNICEVAVNLAAFNADREVVLAGFDKVDYSVYSDKEVDKTTGKTYLTLAKEKVAKGKAEASEMEIYDAETFTKDRLVHLTGSMAIFKNFVKDYVVEKTIYVDGTGNVGLGVFYVKDIPTNDQLENQGVIDAATVAQTKATIQKIYADYITDKTITPDKAYADAYVTVYNFFAEEGKVTSAALASHEAAGLKNLRLENALKTAVADVEDLEAFATKYKAERDATGALVRDAAEVDKIVKEAKMDRYMEAVSPSYTVKLSIADAKDKIIALTKGTAAAELQFAKEVAKKMLADAKSDIIGKYYALEAAKVEAKYEKLLAEVEAATTPEKVKTIVASKDAAKTALKAAANDKQTVDSKVNFGSGAPMTALAAVNAYIDYANSGKTALDAAYIIATPDAVKKALLKVYGEAGARKPSEYAAVKVDTAAIVASLPTVGALSEAKKAADDAIKALPTKPVTADKDAVLNAWTLADDYSTLAAKAVAALALEYSAELDLAVTNLFADMQYDFAKKIANVDKKDKAALRALQDEIDAANDLDMFDGKTPKFDANGVVAKAITAIRDAELKAVKAAIDAIPVNVTEADKATVQAARKAYDEFVKDWTVYNNYNDYDAAAQVTNFRTLALAEATLGLSVGDPALKVEAMKLRAYSKYAKKGITVKWVIEDGRKSDAKGYQVWRSTKANTGYKKLITVNPSYGVVNAKNLKKGVTYYYKVRAYNRTADGKLVFSDWSNKAYRKAK